MPEPQIEVWATPNYLVWIIHSEIICVPGQLLRSADWIILLFQLFNSTSNWELALECEGCEVIFCCSQLLSPASGDVSKECEGCREEPKVGGQKWGRVWEPRMRALEWHPGESKAADCRPGASEEWFSRCLFSHLGQREGPSQGSCFPEELFELNLTLKCFFFVCFWLSHASSRILVPWSGIELRSPAV